MKDVNELMSNGYKISKETYSREDAINEAQKIREQSNCFAQATYEVIYVYHVATKNKKGK